MSPLYSRILLKLSGEALLGGHDYGISREGLEKVAREILPLHRAGLQIVIVIGAGNIWRGVRGESEGMDRSTADYMGMLATMMNSMALQDVLEHSGIPTRILSALPIPQVGEPYIRRRAIRHLEKGRVVIAAAGTGNPYFTTDTAAALRASELGCEVLLKATKVDGIYTADPKKDPTATRYDEITYDEVYAKQIGVMDQTAIALCREQKLPVLVFDFWQEGSLQAAVEGKAKHTLVR